MSDAVRLKYGTLCLFCGCRVSQRYFLRYAARQGGSQQAVAFLHALPKRFHSAKTYNMVLQVCAAAGDIEAATLTLEFADKQRVRLDIKMLTSFINGERAAAQPLQ